MENLDSQPGDKPAQPADQPEPLVPVEPTALSHEELNDLRQQAAKAAEHWEHLLRTTADFENYRKRAAREKQEAIKYANESLLEKLVPVLDSLDRALAAAQTDSNPAQFLLQGVQMVYQQFQDVLARAGLETVDAAGARFDPNLHEAVAQQESADVPEDHVLHQVRKGYKLKDRLLRPASVVVAKAPPSQS